MKRATPLRRTPFKRKRQAPTKNRQQVLDRANGWCEARFFFVCTNKVEHVHHIVLRSRGGSDDPSNLIALCHKCHEHIHANPAWATEHGYMRSGAA